MDQLSIIKAVFEHQLSLINKNIGRLNNIREKSFILGYGFGYTNWEAIKKKGPYGIIVIIDSETPENAIKGMPKTISLSRWEIPQLADKEDVPEKIRVKIKYIKEKPHDLERVCEKLPPSIPLPISISSSSPISINTFTPGDPVFTKSVWIGTGGYVLHYQGQPHILSNKHVFNLAGIGGSINNIQGQKLAEVSYLNPHVDSALARLEPYVQFSVNIPGIGIPINGALGIDVGMDCKKRGAATGVTNFKIIWKGIYQGVESVVGTHPSGNKTAIVGNGDSGSVILGASNNIIGLVTSGSNIVGVGPGGNLYENIWAVDIRIAFPDIIK